MRLREIVIQDFRKLRGTTRITGLVDGLNVIAGDNEDGKSTLLAAIRAALFERHRLRGQLAESFQPFGSGTRPRVALTFSIGDESYRLHKAFCQEPEAILITPTARFDGSKAEAHLGELLGMRVPGRGASSVEDRGACGLLWVEQGSGFSAPMPSDPIRASLSSAIESEVTEVLGGTRGAAVLRSVAERYQELLGKLGKPRGAFRTRLARVDELERAVAEAENLAAAHDEQLERLQTTQRELTRLRETSAIEQAKSALDRARQAAREVQRREVHLREATQAHELAVAQHTEAAARLHQRTQFVRQLRAAHQAMADLTTQLSEERKRIAPLDRSLREIDLRLTRTRSERERWAHERRKAERDVELAQAHAEANSLEQELRKIEQAEANRLDAEEKLDALPANEETLGALGALRDRERAARARLAAASTTLNFSLRSDAEVTLDGVPVSAGESRRITMPTELHIEGVGSISVIPGDASLEDRRRTHEDALGELQRELTRWNIVDLDEVREQRILLRHELNRAEAVLQALAPEGSDRVRTRLRRARERLAELESEIRTSQQQLVLTADGFDAQPKLGEVNTILRRISSAYDRTDREQVRLEEERAEAVRTRDAVRETLIRLQGEYDGLESRVREIEAQLDSERLPESDDELRQTVARVENRRELAAAARVAAQGALLELDPEGTQRTLDDCETRYQDLTVRWNDLTRGFDITRSWLEARGCTGIGEEIARLNGELELARSLAEKDQREAGAISLLKRTLEECVAEAKNNTAGAVAKRVQGYIRELFPGARVQLNPSLGIDSLGRDGVAEPFATLSHGTREQVAILTRLAFADLLAVDLEPPPLVLDDVLAYSDPQRFQQMQRILQRAAKRVQIVVLTCRPQEWKTVTDAMFHLVP